ncbi:MAG: TRAP transporter small permease subunit [Pararhodobacter sp.]|nr:TRAP transporter small permease subunit [Pararhodobacter sp.]
MDELIQAGLRLWQALVAGDIWMLVPALRHQVLFWVVAIGILPLSLVILGIFKALPLLDRHLETTAMFCIYMGIAMIIFVEVIRRFVFSVQAPWSTTLPPYLFLLLTWIGCAYNVKLRTHLSFGEVRAMMPPKGQLALSFLDAILWYVMAVVVVVATVRLTATSASNYQLLLGTDNVMRWWFYIIVPISWLILYARVIENLIEDVRKYQAGRALTAGNELPRE